MQKVCLVLPYFGKTPKWFNIFVVSCINNQEIDFLIYSDCLNITHQYPNIRIINQSIDDFNTLASNKLALNICIKDGYKLCDLRPAFGIIFEDYLEDYDFWGHFDTDVIFGDISKFILNDLLDSYDIITSRLEFVTGHFTIYKNTDKLNCLYKRSNDYEMVFTTINKVFSFEECGRIHHFLVSGKKIDEIEPTVDSMMHVMHRSSDIKLCHKELVEEKYYVTDRYFHGLKNWKFVWDNGKIYDYFTNNEFMYFHFIVYKRKPSFYIPDWETIPNKFIISDKGFSFYRASGLFASISHLFSRSIYFIGFTFDIFFKKKQYRNFLKRYVSRQIKSGIKKFLRKILSR